MERKALAQIIETMEQADELLSAELNRFTIRPQNIKKARDIVQQVVNELEEMVRSNHQSVLIELVPSETEHLL